MVLPQAPTVFAPSAEFSGTEKLLENPPLALVTGWPELAHRTLCQHSVTTSLAPKPDPVTDTTVPGGPEAGEIEIVVTARAGSASQRTDPASTNVSMSANPR